MTTFKAEIQNKRQDGTYNVRIRVTHNRVVRRLSTNIYVTAEDLTRSLKIKNDKTIKQSDAIISQCRDFCNDLGFSINTMSADDLVERLKNKLEGGEKFKLDFIEYTKLKAEKMQTGTAGLYVTMLNALLRYTKRESLDISEINASFLRGFEDFLKSEPSQRGSNRKGKDEAPQQKGARAVSLYISRVRAIHNLAKKEYNDEDRGIIRIPYSPFKNFKIKAQPPTRKRALPVEVIQAIINLPYEGKRFDLAKDCFILSFALIGMNSADMYHVNKPKKNILTYNRRKTATRRDDKAEIQIRVEGAIDQLIEKYQDRERLFNFHTMYANPQTFNRAINKGLDQIGERLKLDALDFYAARHSWATIASSSAVGIDKATVHDALNHSNSKMKVTEIYIDRDWSNIWNANKKVLALFDWSAVGYDLL